MSAEVGTNRYEQVKAVPSLEFVFTGLKKSMTDRISGKDLITFTRTTVGTYVDENGVIQTADINEPRFDYDPETGESLGLLIEESRTNSLPYSNTLTGNGATGDGWGKNTSTGLPTTEVTLQPNAEIAPDGTFTASKLIQAPTAGLQRWWYFNFAPRATGWTGSIFAKAAESDRIVLNVGFGGASVQAIFDLSNVTATYNGNVTYTSNTTQTITPYPNGWYKCSISTTVDFGFNVYYQLYFIDENNNTGFQGDGVSGIYVWGAQLEQATFPTSYIPTDGTLGGIIRGADVASITGTNFSSWYNNSGGTFYADCNSVDGVNGVFSVGTSTSPNEGLSYDFSSFNSIPADVVLNGTFNPVGSPHKFAVTSQTGTISLYADGVLQDTDTATNAQRDGVILVIGNRSTYGGGISSLYLNGTISRITYWPVRLADTYLQELTQ